MFSFERLQYSKIPIKENKRRVEYLSLFRDLLNDQFGWNQEGAGPSSKLGQLNPEQRRVEINKRKSIAHEMITLAGIRTRRACAQRVQGSQDRTTFELDVIDRLWDTYELGISMREPVVAVEEAIGVYEHDQKRASFRTRNPIFWILRVVEWIAELPFWFIGLFGFNQKEAEESKTGRVVKGVMQVGVFVAFGWLVQLLVNLIQLLHAFGWDKVILQRLGLP
jgi:hypothetical protein